MTITVRGAASDAQLARLHAGISAVQGTERAPPFTRVSERVAFANLAPEQLALSRSSQDAVDEIRALDAPGASAILVSGNTARFMDQKQSLADHLRSSSRS